MERYSENKFQGVFPRVAEPLKKGCDFQMKEL